MPHGGPIMETPPNSFPLVEDEQVKKLHDARSRFEKSAAKVAQLSQDAVAAAQAGKLLAFDDEELDTVTLLRKNGVVSPLTTEEVSMVRELRIFRNKLKNEKPSIFKWMTRLSEKEAAIAKARR